MVTWQCNLGAQILLKGAQGSGSTQAYKCMEEYKWESKCCYCGKNSEFALAAQHTVA